MAKGIPNLCERLGRLRMRSTACAMHVSVVSRTLLRMIGKLVLAGPITKQHVLMRKVHPKNITLYLLITNNSVIAFAREPLTSPRRWISLVVIETLMQTAEEKKQSARVNLT